MAGAARSPQWLRVVMDAHGGRCTCIGQCGSLISRGARHAGSEELRCSVTEDLARPWPLRVLVAPVDPGVSESVAAGLAEEELTAWCVPCWGRARALEERRAGAARAAELAEAAPLLFVLGGERR